MCASVLSGGGSVSTHGGGGGVKDFGLMKILGLIFCHKVVILFITLNGTQRIVLSILYWMETFTK